MQLLNIIGEGTVTVRECWHAKYSGALVLARREAVVP
jgi:hypothetical protein